MSVALCGAGNMILVVDDHEPTRGVLVRILKLEGYAAMAAESGAEALAFLKVYTPRLIVLDYSMPDMDGLTLFSLIRHDEKLKHIPVIMFSANGGQVKEQALKAGVDAYIVKASLDWMNLSNEIARLAGPPSSDPALPRVNPLRSRDIG